MLDSTTPTDVLERMRGAEPSLDGVVSRAYQELRAIAHARLVGRGPGATMSTTALVHEAYLKLADQSRAGARDHGHFLALASLAMRHVLGDAARARHALKRGGLQQQVTLDDSRLGADEQAETVLQFSEALDRLTRWEPRLARVVECRFFGGLSEPETADALGVTVRTVQRDWVKARVLLQCALES